MSLKMCIVVRLPKKGHAWPPLARRLASLAPPLGPFFFCRRDTDREPEGQAHRGVPREGGEPGESQRDMLNLRKHSVLSDPDRTEFFP